MFGVVSTGSPSSCSENVPNLPLLLFLLVLSTKRFVLKLPFLFALLFLFLLEVFASAHALSLRHSTAVALCPPSHQQVSPARHSPSLPTWFIEWFIKPKLVSINVSMYASMYVCQYVYVYVMYMYMYMCICVYVYRHPTIIPPCYSWSPGDLVIQQALHRDLGWHDQTLLLHQRCQPD